jgi:hypothetical protein
VHDQTLSNFSAKSASNQRSLVMRLSDSLSCCAPPRRGSFLSNDPTPFAEGCGGGHGLFALWQTGHPGPSSAPAIKLTQHLVSDPRRAARRQIRGSPQESPARSGGDGASSVGSRNEARSPQSRRRPNTEPPASAAAARRMFGRGVDPLGACPPRDGRRLGANRFRHIRAADGARRAASRDPPAARSVRCKSCRRTRPRVCSSPPRAGPCPKAIPSTRSRPF